MESAWVEVNGGKIPLVDYKRPKCESFDPKGEFDVVSQNFGRSKI
jgi:hypothetical protein